MICRVLVHLLINHDKAISSQGKGEPDSIEVLHNHSRSDSKKYQIIRQWKCKIQQNMLPPSLVPIRIWCSAWKFSRSFLKVCTESHHNVWCISFQEPPIESHVWQPWSFLLTTCARPLQLLLSMPDLSSVWLCSDLNYHLVAFYQHHSLFITSESPISSWMSVKVHMDDMARFLHLECLIIS